MRRCAGGIVCVGNKLLLVDNPEGERPGYTLLKGQVRTGETLNLTAMREVREGAGIKATPSLYLGAFTHTSIHPETYGEIKKTDVFLMHWAGATLAPEELAAIPAADREVCHWVDINERVMRYPEEDAFIERHRPTILDMGAVLLEGYSDLTQLPLPSVGSAR